jgi:hypothetical protein
MVNYNGGVAEAGNNDQDFIRAYRIEMLEGARA